MNRESRSSVPASPPKSLWELPNVEHIEIVRVRYEPPKAHVVEGRLQHVVEAVELLICTETPIPSRALAPALFVGEVTLTESEDAGESCYRFFAFEPDRLVEGAPIALGWTMHGSPRRETGFRYQIGKQPTG